MNAKPCIPGADGSRSFSRCTVIVSMVILVGCGLVLEPGCVDPGAASPPVKPVQAVSQSSNPPSVAITDAATTIEKPIENNSDQQVQDEIEEAGQDNEKDESSKGVLGTAGRLLDKAKSKGGSAAVGASQWVQDKIDGAANASGQTADDTWKWANETFEALKAQGLTTSKTTSDWLGQDWKKMESWEYKVVTIDGTDDELAERLNGFGKQGWECFNAENKSAGMVRFYLKKPTFSYLRQLPFKDVIKLVPMMNMEGK